MPILVKDYTWIQTEKMLNIRVPLKKSTHGEVDLFTTDSYMKAHISPFLFEVFLLHEIETKKSKCLVQDDVIIIDLLKKEAGEWESLEKDLTKEEKRILRQEILDKYAEEAKKESEDKKIKRSYLDRYTVQQAMEIDSKHHALMDARRDDERKKAMNALEDWRKSKEIEPQTPYTTPHPKQPDDLVPNMNQIHIQKPASGVIITELSSSEDEADKKPPPIRKPPSKKLARTPVRSEYVEKKKEEVAKRVLPRMREYGTVEISHTPRNFPTPSRESAHEEEQAWLKNITMARRATGFVSEDLRPEEQDPQWCKDKGDEFFRAGNFLGAISAYTHGISLSDKLPSLFSNRAATHFALGNFNKCVNDCSTALDLLKPACEGNRQSRAKCVVRRAAALARLGYLNKAIGEMKAASKLLPEDETIKKDIYDMERAWEQNPDSE